MKTEDLFGDWMDLKGMTLSQEPEASSTIFDHSAEAFPREIMCRVPSPTKACPLIFWSLDS